jgi:hypothetical protein
VAFRRRFPPIGHIGDAEHPLDFRRLVSELGELGDKVDQPYRRDPPGHAEEQRQHKPGKGQCSCQVEMRPQGIHEEQRRGEQDDVGRYPVILL